MNAAALLTTDAEPLNVCGLEPPEPMVRILDALDLLSQDECLHVLIDREPVPLYRVLWRNGYQHVARQRADGHWCLQIRAAAGSDDI